MYRTKAMGVRGESCDPCEGGKVALCLARGERNSAGSERDCSLFNLLDVLQQFNLSR